METLVGLSSLMLVCALGTWASAQTIQGTGDNWGRGYHSDGSGGLQGTGENWGGGWRTH